MTCFPFILRSSSKQSSRDAGLGVVITQVSLLGTNYWAWPYELLVVVVFLLLLFFGGSGVLTTLDD